MEIDDIEQVANDRRWNLIQRKAQRVKSAQVFEHFREHSIDPILIKGLAAHLNYPEDHFRYSVDVDLAVAPADFDAATDLVAAGLPGQILIDIHKGLRHLDAVVWEDLFDNSILVDIDGAPVRMLRPEDHLRVLCVHWLNDGGAYKERLWDIYYAVANRPADFDWERCLNVVSKRRRKWILTAIGLANRYLDLNIDDLPFADEARRIPAWVIKCIEREWAGGVRIKPIAMVLKEPKELFRQIMKRMPPNALESTIEMEGDFNSPIRLHYQIGGAAKRLLPSLKSLRTAFRFRKS